MPGWSKYNRELVNRARVDVYFSEEILDSWYNEGSQGAFRPRKYSDSTIKTCMLIKTLFRLPYRQTEGMVRSLTGMLGAKAIEVPSYSQINRRQARCKIESKVQKAIDSKERIIIAVDSTGLSLYTPGQWHQRKHGAKKSKWLKLHAAVDVETGEVLDYQVTDSNYSDGRAARDMLDGNLANKDIGEFLGDGAYDEIELYKLLHMKNIKPNIRIRSDAVISDSARAELEWRNEQILRMLSEKFKIPQLDRKDLFRKIRVEDGYGLRALSENFFSRFKAIFGDKLQSRKMHNIKTEIAAKIAIINSFAAC